MNQPANIAEKIALPITPKELRTPIYISSGGICGSPGGDAIKHNLLVNCLDHNESALYFRAFLVEPS